MCKFNERDMNLLCFAFKLDLTTNMSLIFSSRLSLIPELESVVGRFHHQSNKASRLSQVSNLMQILIVDVSSRLLWCLSTGASQMFAATFPETFFIARTILRKVKRTSSNSDATCEWLWKCFSLINLFTHINCCRNEDSETSFVRNAA